MLELLKIKNIAIIDFAEIPFRQGLNILSGETGAGKSIIIEAISLLLGGRASSELIRSGCEEAVVEGIFEISGLDWVKNRLDKLGFDSNSNELLIKRTVHRSGRHRITINGEFATVSGLQNLCEGLIDLCSQNEHQSLIRSTVQLNLLDRYGNLTSHCKKFSKLWERYKDKIKKRDELFQSEQERIRRIDFLKFQIEEIQSAELIPSEEESLQKEKQLLQSAKARVQAVEAARNGLEAEDQGALVALKCVLQKLRNLESLDSQAHTFVECIERAIAEAEDVCVGLHRYINLIDLDPERLLAIQDRLACIADLKRKYGGSVEQVLETCGQLSLELDSLNSASVALEDITKELNIIERDLRKEGKKLSNARKKISSRLQESITRELKDLKMGNARFCIDLSHRLEIDDWTCTGADQLVFQIQTNLGEEAKPIGKIASGGELSRLMLAIRRVIANRGGIGVYLFDEIDSGMGGQTAFEVGRKLKSVSSYNQVICITHLPQVASFADHHLVVRKSIQGKRTITLIQPLVRSERKEELARMLAGPELTRRSLENASELLELAHSQSS